MKLGIVGLPNVGIGKHGIDIVEVKKRVLCYKIERAHIFGTQRVFGVVSVISAALP